MDILRKIHKTGWEFVKNLSVDDYAKLMKQCVCVVGNSSSFIKEASFLGIAAVIVGNRQKGRETDKNVILTEIDRYLIESATMIQADREYEPSNYFGDGTASTKIANILAEVEL
jgi:UDP-N-acetylglucosamine 2-epimerase